MTDEKAIDLLDNLVGMVSDNQESDYDTALKVGIHAIKMQSKMLERIKYLQTSAKTFKERKELEALIRLWNN